jgi:5-methylthioadenosine/S-adenosylhomocysteine deaminase
VILTSRLVLPISAPPIPDGALMISDGAIAAIGQAAALSREFPDEPREDLGNAVLLPGLVNAHTHLELTGLQGQLPLGRSFSEWLVALISLRRAMTQAFFDRSATEGAARLLRGGVTCVADITASGASLPAIRDAGLRGIVFQEVVGLDPDEAAARAYAAEDAVHALADAAQGGLVGVGLSPHAPYSLSEPLLARCAELIRRGALPATIHLCESADEVTYIGLGLGPIATDLLPVVGRRWPSHRVCGESPVALLARCGLLSDRLLAVHAVHVGASDIELLARHDVALALCPRSNHYLRVGAAPLPRYAALRLRLGLGTDSLASNESLSLWDELRFALASYEGAVTARDLLRMATLGGASALGLDAHIGSLEPGKRADLTAVAIEALGDDDPYRALVLRASEASVILTMVNGTVRYRG